MRNKILDSFAIDFIRNHFDEIDLKRCEWDVKTKEQAIKEIKKDDRMAGWIIIVVMVWGTPTDYAKQYKVEMTKTVLSLKLMIDILHLIMKIFITSKKYFLRR